LFGFTVKEKHFEVGSKVSQTSIVYDVTFFLAKKEEVQD